MYNATSTDDEKGDLERYENWLERQLISRIERLEQLDLANVSGQSELLFAFIKAVKEEFADQNWDYLDFIAERVIGKQ